MELPELVLVTVANYRDLCEYVQGELASLGWKIEVNVVPSATLRSEKSSGSLDFFRASWIADYPDAENYLMLFYGPLKAPNGPNYSRYQNSEYDALYEQIISESNIEVRSELIRKADLWLMEQQVCVPLFYDEVLRVYPNYVEGVHSNALNSLNLLKARLTR
jgi:peptide/nickel transport system substrate-binding protein